MILPEFTIKNNATMATMAHKIDIIEDIFNPSVVKVVLDKQKNAMYFSRSTIPYSRDDFVKQPIQIPHNLDILRHIGIYAYTVDFLKTFKGSCH